MAVNLNPGADATLVTAATRAAMANVPKDLSQMFAAQTENYRKTMESVGKSYGEIIKNVASVAKPFVQEQIHNQKMKNLGRDLHSRGLGVKFEDRLNKLRDDKKAIFGLKGSERRNARRNIKIEQEKLFADIQITEDGIHSLSEQVASGNYSEKGTSLFNQVQAQGIANGNNPIKEGPYKGFVSVPTTNADGDRGWQLQNAEGKVVSNIAQDGTVTLASKGTSAVIGVDAVESGAVYDENDTPRYVEAVEGVTAVDAVNAVEGSFVSNSKIGSLLQGKVALETETGLNALTNDALNGKKSLSGTKPSIERQIDGMVTEGNIAALQNKTLGNNPRTFMDDLHSESKLSVEMFNALKGVEGLQDSNDSGKIDKGDFASPENMKILNEAMRPGSSSYDYDTAKNAFKSWYADSVINSSNLSENLKKKEEGLFSTIKQGGTLELGGLEIPKESLGSYYGDIEAGNEFKIGDYTYTPKFGGWEKSDIPNGVIGKYEDTADMLKNGLGPGGRHEGFNDIKQFEENTEGVFINKELDDKINKLFGTGRTEESAVENLNILFKDEPLLKGMFTDPMGMGQIIKFNGVKYDVEKGADAGALKKDINEYLKENKKEGTEEVVQKTTTPNTAVVANPPAAVVDSTTTPNAVVVDSTTSDQNVVTPEVITQQAAITPTATNAQNEYTKQEVSSANPFNESVSVSTGLPNKGSVASTYSEYKGRNVPRGQKTTFEFSKTFVKAVGNDEYAIQRYIKRNPNVYPGVEIITDGVKGNDAFIIKVNGKEKKFQADPKLKVKYGTVGSNDQRRALEIHDWIKENSKGSGEPTFPGLLPEVAVDGNANLIKEGPNKGKPSTWSVIKPGAFELNQGLMDSIVTNEGFVEGGLPYKDVGGLPTIGFGYTKYSLDGKDGRPLMSEYWKDGKATGKVMTKEDAIMLQPLVASIYKDQVDNSVTNKSINTEQYNVLVDLAYRNGNANVKSSGIYKAINKGDIKGAIEILKTSKALYKVGGKVEYAENGTDFKENGIYKRNMDLVAKLEKSLKPNLG